MTGQDLVVHRPAPPVPSECVMRGDDWFPLKFIRLRKSKWWRRASDTARARNVMMWGEAYQAQPAGSLADDDDELAEAAGYGLNVEAFLAHKDEIMSCWTLCSDGRWYHPTVVEMVLERWDDVSARRKADAERKRKQRDKARGVVTSEEADVTPPRPKVTPPEPDVTRDSGENGRDFATQEKTLQDKTEESSPEGDLGGKPPSGSDEMEGLGGMGAGGAKPAAKGLPVRHAYDAYNEAAGLHGWAVAKALNSGRREKLQARLKEVGYDGWVEALEQASRSSFLMGQEPPRNGQQPFKMDLDFLLQAKSFQRLIEGKYDDRTGANGGLGQRGQALGSLHAAAMGLGDSDY